MYEQIISESLKNLSDIPFSAAFLLLFFSMISLFINVAAAERKKADLDSAVKSFISCYVTIVILLILSSIPNMYLASVGALVLVYAACVKNILTFLEFSGLEFPALVAFLDLISVFFSIDRIKASIKKGKLSKKMKGKK